MRQAILDDYRQASEFTEPDARLGRSGRGLGAGRMSAPLRPSAAMLAEA